MKNRQQFASVFIIIIGIFFIISISSCSSDDNSSNNASIVGDWNLVNFTQRLETNTTFEGIPVQLTIINEGESVNCVYHFTENPNLFDVTGIVNLTTNYYTFNQLVDSSEVVLNYDDYDFEDNTWEIVNDNEIIIHNLFQLLSTNTLISDDTVNTITTLTDTTLIITTTGTFTLFNSVTNNTEVYAVDGVMNLERN